MSLWRNIDLTGIKRTFSFPYPVSACGYNYDVVSRGELSRTMNGMEVCFRYHSSGKYACDVIDNVSYETSFPHVILKQPLKKHCYWIKDPRDAIYFTYSHKIVERLERDGFIPPVPIWNVTFSLELRQITSTLLELVEHSREHGVCDRIDLLCFRMFEELLFMRCNPNPENGEAKILRVASYMDLHYSEDINVNELAAGCGMSRSVFFRNWNRVFDVTPTQYLLDLRLSNAASALADGSQSIMDVAARVHFSGLTSFYAKFKKKYGILPAEYRKKNAISP